MKENFSCSLTGKHWWKPFVICVVLYLAIMIPNQLASMNPSEVPEKALAALLFSLTLTGLFIVVQAAFSVVLMKIAFPHISIKGKPLTFTGKVGEYVKINILGFLLCIITLTFYFPFYNRKLLAYLAEHTYWEGSKVSFTAKSGKLMKYYILALILPLLVISTLFVVAVIAMNLAKTGAVSGSFGSATLVFYLVLFIAIIPFMYLAYKWTVNFAWNGFTVSWDTRFWDSCGFILGQLCLTIITVGIAWPLAFVNIIRFFAGKTVVRENGAEKGRLGFDCKRGKAFTLLWGQTLLVLITCGIYLPWAYANCMRFMISNSYYEEKQEMLSQS